MKTIKYVLPALLAVAAFTLTACGGDDDDNGGKKGNFSTDYVDLGLSVKWATCNVGAKNPWEAGNYYAWGETSPKSSYAPNNYVYRDVTSAIDRLPASNDAATANLGGKWRMPTKSEFEELINNCTWTWTTLNGVNGFRVEGKNDNYIFLPAVGFYNVSKQFGIPDAAEKEVYGYSDGCYLWVNQSYYKDESGHYYDEYNGVEYPVIGLYPYYASFYTYDSSSAQADLSVNRSYYGNEGISVPQSWSGVPVRAVRP